MKKTLIMFSLIAAMRLDAQEVPEQNTTYYNNAFGLRAGESSGITFKHFKGNNTAYEFILSAWPNDLSIFGLYEKYKPINELSGLNFYYGGGGHVAFNTYSRVYYRTYSDGRAYWWYKERSGFGLGIDGIVGLEYKFRGIPLAISLDLKPYIEFNTDDHVYWSPDPGLGIKVTF